MSDLDRTDLYNPHISFMKLSDRQALGAFLAGEGTLTVADCARLAKQLGYEAMSGDDMPAETPLMVSLVNRPRDAFTRPYDRRPGRSNGPNPTAAHTDEVPLIIDADAEDTNA